jgi:hypothetical protein
VQVDKQPINMEMTSGRNSHSATATVLGPYRLNRTSLHVISNIKKVAKQFSHGRLFGWIDLDLASTQPDLEKGDISSPNSVV